MKYETQYDMMTKQPVESLILRLGLPTTISMLVTSIYNMADSYFVGQINTSASGATGVVFGLMAILQAVGFMFGHGAGSIISRRLGAKKVLCYKLLFGFGGRGADTYIGVFISDSAYETSGKYRYDTSICKNICRMHINSCSCDGYQLCHEQYTQI